MNAGFGRLREALKKVFQKLHLEIANALGGDFRLHYAVRSPAQIDRGRRKGLVHGHKKISGTQNAAFGAERPLYGFAKGDADVFDRVVLVDVEIPARFDLQVKGTMARHKIEHMVEKADSRGDARFAAPIQIELQANVCLVRFTMNRCFACHVGFSRGGLFPRFPFLYDGIQQTLHFALRSNRDAHKSWSHLFAFVAQKNSLLLQLPK